MRPGGRSICSVVDAWYSGVLVRVLTSETASPSTAKAASTHLYLFRMRSSALMSSESSTASAAVSRNMPVCSMVASRSDKAVVRCGGWVGRKDSGVALMDKFHSGQGAPANMATDQQRPKTGGARVTWLTQATSCS